MQTNAKKERLVIALACAMAVLVVLMMISVAVAVGCYLGMAAGWTAVAVELMVLCLMCVSLLRWAVRLGEQTDDTST